MPDGGDDRASHCEPGRERRPSRSRPGCRASGTAGAHRDPYCRRTATPWLPRLSSTTMSPGRRVGTRNCVTHARNRQPLMAPSNTQGATRPSERKAATNVMVVQRACGTEATRRCPRKARPWVRVCWSMPRSRRRKPSAPGQRGAGGASTARAAVDVGTVLLGARRLFFKVSRSSRRKRHTAS